MLAEFLFERRPPRHQLESKPIVNHREAARHQRHALAIGASDVFAVGGGAMRKAGFSCELGDRLIQLALRNHLAGLSVLAPAATALGG